MANKYAEARYRAVAKYKAANYDRMGMNVPKGQKAEIVAHAAAMGESLNAFLTRAARETMERDKANEQR